jgi:hypothetical protein
MRTMVLLLATTVLFSAAALMLRPTQLLAYGGGGFGFQRVIDSNSIERPLCARQRVCHHHGCVWRIICR